MAIKVADVTGDQSGISVDCGKVELVEPLGGAEFAVRWNTEAGNPKQSEDFMDGSAAEDFFQEKKAELVARCEARVGEAAASIGKDRQEAIEQISATDPNPDVRSDKPLVDNRAADQAKRRLIGGARGLGGSVSFAMLQSRLRDAQEHFGPTRIRRILERNTSWSGADIVQLLNGRHPRKPADQQPDSGPSSDGGSPTGGSSNGGAPSGTSGGGSTTGGGGKTADQDRGNEPDTSSTGGDSPTGETPPAIEARVGVGRDLGRIGKRLSNGNLGGAVQATVGAVKNNPLPFAGAAIVAYIFWPTS